MSDPISEFEKMLASVAGVRASSQVPPSERSQEFDSRHELAHFIRDRLAEDLESMVRDTNMPQLLVGEPDGPGNQMKLEAACKITKNHGISWTLEYNGEIVLALHMSMYPTVNAPAE